MSSAKKSCEPQRSLLLVMMTSFASGLQFEIRSPKASGPGLTVRFADNRTGARMRPIIGVAFPKSSRILGILRASRARPAACFTAARPQGMVGPGSAKRNRRGKARRGNRPAGPDITTAYRRLGLNDCAGCSASSPAPLRSWAALRPSVPGISRRGPCRRSRRPRRIR